MCSILDYASKKNQTPLNQDVFDYIKQYIPPMGRCTECDDYLKCEQLFKTLNLPMSKSYGIYPIVKGQNINYTENYLKTCTCCKKVKLCNAHYERAKFFYTRYKGTEGAMCNNCCWMEVG